MTELIIRGFMTQRLSLGKYDAPIGCSNRLHKRRHSTTHVTSPPRRYKVWRSALLVFHISALDHHNETLNTPHSQLGPIRRFSFLVRLRSSS